jgi:histidine ammonia-lyase
MTDQVVLKGEGLKVEDLVKIARENAGIEVSPDAMERVKKCRKLVENLIQKKEKVYGTTTGIGELANVMLSQDQLKAFQKYLIYSHAAGWGKPVPEDVVRATMASRINTVIQGHSGLRPVIVETLVKMVNKGVNPVMYPASVGSCGDLAPLSQAMLVPIGEGEAFYRGKRIPGKDAMKNAGIPTVEYEARDGLSTINGSTLTAGMGALEVYDAERWVKTTEIAAAMTFEALKAVMASFDERLFKARGYPGGIDSAENIRRLTENSELLGHPTRVQDAYSLRSTCQVTGAAKDALRYSRKMVETEINGVADNPLFFEDEPHYRPGANFQGTPLAFALETLGTAVTTVGALSERRMNRILDPHLNEGLPKFLTTQPGMMSGMMVAQYTAASLVCKNRVLCNPAATGSIPVSGNQEDFVSMGTVAAEKAWDILDNSNAILAIELMAATEALEHREGKPGVGSRVAAKLVRKEFPKLEEDRPLYPDIERVTKLVKSQKILKEVEKEIGALK